MSGIYFHIPFCKVKCSYCDFYKTTDNSRMSDLVKALQKELQLQGNYLSDRRIKTIYFGGGTPSLLTPAQISELIDACTKVYSVADDAEITMEANPDDLNSDYLEKIKNSGVNRLSIGIQSFSQQDLKLMKRRHTSAQAHNAVKLAKKANFENISVDLIYGVPGMPLNVWRENLKQVFLLEVQHLSAYHLTYHQGTRLWDDLQKGKLHEIDEKESVLQFDELKKQAKRNGFIHYEISNFAQEGYFSMHNSSYWNQSEYLGLGPSAHSYNGSHRQWNVSSLTHYLLALDHQKIAFEREELSQNDRFNDFIITSLRTIWGLDMNYLENTFGEPFVTHVRKVSEKYRAQGKVIVEDQRIKLDQNSLLISDGIMSDFMVSNESLKTVQP